MIKYIRPIPGALLILLFVFSCEKFEEDFESVKDILKDQDFVVHKGVLTFRDKVAFKKLSDELTNKTPEQLSEWEASINFKSLHSIHEEAIQKEEVFLKQMAEKYPGNTTLTRKELGYTKFTTDLINKGLLVVNEFETVDMNVTVPIYGSIVNEQGIFRIGEDIIMPKLNSYKVIKGGDLSKVPLLNTIEKSNKDNDVYVYEVDRNNFRNHTGNQRSQTWTSCDDINDNYRLIVYEESAEVIEYPPDYPCDIIPASYWLRFRSLKRILGTWQNHSTSLWYVISTVKVEHWKRCDFYQEVSQYTYIHDVINYTNQQFDIPYSHTYNKYYFNAYDIGPCASGGLGSCPPYDPISTVPEDPYGVLFYVTRVHDVFGKGGTFCYVGE